MFIFVKMPGVWYCGVIIIKCNLVSLRKSFTQCTPLISAQSHSCHWWMAHFSRAQASSEDFIVSCEEAKHIVKYEKCIYVYINRVLLILDLLLAWSCLCVQHWENRAWGNLLKCCQQALWTLQLPSNLLDCNLSSGISYTSLKINNA